jgi:hypothetical protein
MTNQEKLDAVRREIRMREYVYPRRVEDKKMTPVEAAREINVMKAIAADYEAKLAAERLL